MFKNYSKGRPASIVGGFSTNFCPISKLAYLVTLFDRKLQVFTKLAKLSIFGIFSATQNVDVSRCARNIE